MELVNPLLFQVDLQGRERESFEWRVYFTESRRLVLDDKYSYELLTKLV